MHDIVGHNLSIMITLADGGGYAATVHPERGTEALRLIGDTGRRALGELRRVLGALREHGDAPDWNPQPDVAAIDPLCDHLRAAGPEVTLRTAGDMHALDQGLQLTAYRIVQEAFTNSLRYAGSRTRIDLTLAVDGDELRILVHDTGPPGDLPAPPPGPYPGQGLIGMRERAAIYHGTAAAGPDPRGGWTVRATLRLSAPPTGGDAS
jgi:signal transduction histidine kinase